MQASDAQYEIRLLPEYLLRIPEELRPATFAECAAFVCRQHSYIPSATITKVTETTYGGRSSYGLPVTTSREYRYCYSALDMVTVYDAHDAGAAVVMSFQQNPAQAEDDVWFAAHKQNSSELYTQENMMGTFDEAALKEKYDDCMDNLSLYILLAQLDLDDYDDVDDYDYDDVEEDLYDAD